MIIVSRKITPRGFKGITLFPFIILASEDLKQNEVLINHERIHLRQQLELLVFPFFLWYGIEYLIKGYENISFEKEAKQNSGNSEYLKSRKPFSFIKYN